MIARSEKLQLAIVFADRFIVALLPILAVAEPSMRADDPQTFLPRDVPLAKLDRQSLQTRLREIGRDAGVADAA